MVQVRPFVFGISYRWLNQLTVRFCAVDLDPEKHIVSIRHGKLLSRHSSLATHKRRPDEEGDYLYSNQVPEGSLLEEELKAEGKSSRALWTSLYQETEPWQADDEWIPSPSSNYFGSANSDRLIYEDGMPSSSRLTRPV